MNVAIRHVQAKIKSIMRITLFLLIIIFVRLCYLQINLTNYFKQKSTQNFQRINKIQPIRGNITDCNGALLATNRPVTDLYWQGSGKSSFTSEQKKALKLLSTILEKQLTSDPECQSSLRSAERYCQQFQLANDLSFEQLGKLEELFPHHQNIVLTTRFQRYYPYKSYASHILGYLGDITLSMRGRMGLEMLFDDTLQGEYGIKMHTINSLGKKLSEKELKQSLTGCTIQTTLDMKLQNIVEKIFPENYTGTMIVMDPQDGSIRAVVSRPSFDPSLFLGPISLTDWNSLQEQQPFLNRAFNATYPPGSIFKLVTVSAALEKGLTTPDAMIECKGRIRFGKRNYWCNRRYGHGKITTAQAVAKSCNILFYEIGKKIDIDQIAQYANIFGLGKKTGIIFHEKEGVIPTKKWKQENKGERWWTGETLSVAIGQSFLSVTPIQIAQMISSIFTQSLITPRILLSEPIQYQPLALKKETLGFLRHSMRAVVTKGTGHRVSHVKDIEIYAKTSTAQVSGLQKRLIDKSHLEHGWFVAYFNYKEHVPLTIVVLIEHAGSSRLPTITAKNFLIEYKKLIDAQEIS